MKTIFTFLLILITTGPLLSQKDKPNIIYIMTDDMGYADLSSYGRKDYQTPNMDKLAAEGMRFYQAYSAGSLCTPTRAGFMTGRYPARTPVGLIEPLRGVKADSMYGLTKDYPSIAALVRDQGYETVLIGKWHLGFLPEHNPVENGFDHYFGILSGAADYISHKAGAGRSVLYENDKPVQENGYLTDLFTEKAIQYLKQPHSKPFFLSLNYNAPHWPWQAPGDKAYPDTMQFTAGGSPATFAQMMKSLDDGIGRVMKAMDELQLSKNTVVIFTNDNGGERYSDNGPFAKRKFSLWEGGIRVPAFVRWPGKITPGSSTQQVAITMDWSATILAIAGGKAHRDFPLDGINLLPVLTGEKVPEDRTLYWRTFQRRNQKAIREGNWKYLLDDKEEYLFDLAADPGEKKDLKTTHPDIFQKMKEKYAKWEKTVLIPIPLN